MLRYFLIFFLFISTSISNAEIKDKIIQNLKDTKNLDFKFEQNINGKIENGNCTIEYPKKIFCEYARSNNKILVSNGKSLVIKTRTSYYRYPLEKTPLNLILDKEFIISKIDDLNNETKINELYKFKLDYENLDIVIYFDEKTLNLVGWTTIDIYQNKVETKLSAVEKNIFVDEEIFDITNYTN